MIGLAHTRLGERVLMGTLSDDRVVQCVVNTLSDRIARTSTFDGLPSRVERFEDCTALLGSNQLNHGVSRLMLEEAVYLDRLVRSLGRPTVAELGRYRGGTTFLLAAAGARVLSIDDDPAVAGFDESLRRALEAHGLADRVTLVLADSQTYPVQPASLDLVLVDADHTYEGVRRDVRTWLPGLVPGGHLLLHDAAVPNPPAPWRTPLKVEGVRRACDELLQGASVVLAATVGTLAHFVVVGAARTTAAAVESRSPVPPKERAREGTVGSPR